MKSSESDADTEEFVLLFTAAGSFKVRATVEETLSRVAAEEWPSFALADGEEQQVVVRSAEVVAVQRIRGVRGSLGFRPS